MKDCICKNCGKKFQSEIIHRYCSDGCKYEYQHRKELLTCDNCGKQFWGRMHFNNKHVYCSDTCRNRIHNTIYRDKVNVQKQEELGKGVEGVDYVSCVLCGKKIIQIGHAHFEAFHPDWNLERYRKEFPDAKITCQSYIDENLAGENNPRSSANVSEEDIRKHSPFCKEFYETRGLDDSVRVEMIKKMSDRPPERKATTLEYYLAQGYTIEEAFEIRKKRYGFTMEKAIEKYGEDDGREFFLERQRKWIRTMYGDSSTCKCKSSISKISQKFVFAVLDSYMNCEKTFRFGKNEYEITGVEHVYRYDLTCLQNKRIIEFHGDLWHGNPLFYKATDTNGVNGQLYAEKWEYDAKKKKAAEDSGFEVMIVWEHDYKYFHDDVVKKAREFIFDGVDTSGMQKSVALF